MPKLFDPGTGSLIGSFVDVDKQDRILSATVPFTKLPDMTEKSRLVTVAYWDIGKNSHDSYIVQIRNDGTLCYNAINVELEYITDLKGNKIYKSDENSDLFKKGENAIWTINTAVNDNRFNTKEFIFINTEMLHHEYLFHYKFKFQDGNYPIYNANESIFLSIISNEKYLNATYDDDVLLTYEDDYLYLPVAKYGKLYYLDDEQTLIEDIYNDTSNLKFEISSNESIMYSLDIRHIDDERREDTEEEASTTGVPSKIECNCLKYRTWSYITDINQNDGWGDGGENPKKLIDYSAPTGTNTSKYIYNLNNDFASDFDFNEGRLKDVYFANPQDGSLKVGKINEPRWVFKRSRIKFFIPPCKDEKGNIIEKAVKIRYRVYTGVFDKTEITLKDYNGKNKSKEFKVYKNEFITKEYTLANSTKNISIVICPRDEGVLDNSEFKVVFQRCYVNGNKWSEESTYYFHTYQRPIVNITNPKITRNDATGDTGFAYPKIIASNLYGNFYGDAVGAKYICDNLLVTLSAPDRDNSLIPMFTRYYLAEYKHGRLNITDETVPPIDTLNDLFSSVNEKDYASVAGICKNSNNDNYDEDDENNKTNRTSYVTNVCEADGKPILISGKFNKFDESKNDEPQYSDVLNKLEKEYDLHTIKHWDGYPGLYDDGDHSIDKSPTVVNAWYSENNADKPEYKNIEQFCPDHYDAPIFNDTDNIYEQKPSNNILFRAGYLYLFKARMFHGAIAGAIYNLYGKYWNKGDIKDITGAYKIGMLYGASDFRYSKYDYLENDIKHIDTEYYTKSKILSGFYNYDYNPDDDGIGDERDINQQVTVNQVIDFKSNRFYPYVADYNIGDEVYIKNVLEEKYDGFSNNIYGKWTGPSDGTSNKDLNGEDVNQTYTGFSEHDYTFIKPIVPYTSKNNLITVHPSSYNIGANQWLSFNYRHLSKNLGNIEWHAVDNEDTGAGSLTERRFGKTIGGSDNTITRITKMYSSICESIRTSLQKLIPINVKDIKINNILNQVVDDDVCNETDPNHLAKCSKYDANIYIDAIMNNPESNYEYIGLYNKERGESSKLCTIKNNTITYESNTACNTLINNLENPTAIDILDTDYETWPEAEIVANLYNYKKINNNSTKEPMPDPLGNSYIWSPVINAIKNNLEEIKIEDKYSDKKIKPYGFEYALQNVFKDSAWNDFESKGYTLNLSYTPIQKYYFELTDNNSNSTLKLVSNKDKLFSIKEFAGVTYYKDNNNDINYNELRSNSGNRPVMYTLPNTDGDTIYRDKQYDRLFTLDNTNKDSYGLLYSRVPIEQDCECGNIHAFNKNTNSPSLEHYYTDLNNTGGIYIKSNVKAEISNIDSKYINDASTDGFYNIYPLVRTTHYLFFKTYINTNIVCEIVPNINYYKDCEEDDDGDHITGSNTTFNKTIYFNFANNSFSTEKVVNKFGNSVGISAVYAEDNHGYGRCLSADDASSRKIKFDGSTSDMPESGGIEVPILVRYTPTLQPKIINEFDNNNAVIIRNKSSSSIKWVREVTTTEIDCNELCIGGLKSTEKMVPKLVYGSSTSISNTEIINLLVSYPYIKESNSYCTKPANGGYTHSDYGNNFSYDIDTNPDNTMPAIDENENSMNTLSNRDFLGGYGICTGYTVLLVPTDVDFSKLIPENIDTYDEKELYKNIGCGRFNYFKQKANYYSTNHPYENIRSKSVENAGPVIVAYNKEAEALKDSYTTDECDLSALPNQISTMLQEQFGKTKGLTLNEIGRSLCNIKIDFKKLFNGDFENKNKCDLKLDECNRLKSGLNYDLVIIPIYSTKQSAYNYDGISTRTVNDETYPIAGTVNGTVYGTGENDNEKDVVYYGSNPYIVYDYLQLSTEYYSNSAKLPDSYVESETIDLYKCSDCDILETDHAIIFPNVDNETFNMDKNKETFTYDGETRNVIKECPGFWLNNSFRLVLRLPSFRTNDELKAYYDNDNMIRMSESLEQMSHGIVTTKDPNDFEFDDIQIHIGKLDELKDYGYPNNMDGSEGDNNINKDKECKPLNNYTTKDELAKLHIISYKHYWDKNVFSKKLRNYQIEDPDNDLKDNDGRSKATAGALHPNNENYNNRFIEVDLSNVTIKNEDGKDVPIYSNYPEGFYIQFRYKTAYSSGEDSIQWSDWHGGSYDGGKKWWGDKGIGYYVPVRNYTDIHTEFRSYIKDSFASSLVGNIKDDNENYITGQGTLMKKGSIVETENVHPRISTEPAYYTNGNGNHPNSVIVPSLNDNTDIYNDKNTTIISTVENDHDIIPHLVNNDAPYNVNNIKNNSNFVIPENITNFSQQMWEMLYVDYIVRNMCKLYYKEKYNDVHYVGDNEKFCSSHLAAPITKINDSLLPLILDYRSWGWDDYRDEKLTNVCIETNNDYIEKYENDKNVISHEKNNHRKRWNNMKYYRKPISKFDFEELNRHLQDLVNFIYCPEIFGKISYNELNNQESNSLNEITIGNKNIINCTEEDLEFIKERRKLIGHDLFTKNGHSSINNTRNRMMSSNYIQQIWDNILAICTSSKYSDLTYFIQEVNSD